MKRRRPLGAKLIAIFFFLKSAAVILAVISAKVEPEHRASAQNFIGQLVPAVQGGSSDIALVIALLFAFLGVALGLGVWFLQKWARFFLILDCGIPLGRLAIVLAMFTAIDWKLFALLPSSPYFFVDVCSSILILGYLLDPDAKAAFGVKI